MILKRRRNPLPTRDRRRNRKEKDAMMYRFNPNQFVENGAAVLAERARIARLSAHKHELLRRRYAVSSDLQPRLAA